MTVTSTDAQRRLHIEYAEALEADAETSGEKCNDLVEAADYWHSAGEHEREERALLAAVEADDGNNVLSGPAAHGKFLLTHGRRAEAEERFARLLREGSNCEWAYVEASMAYQLVDEPQEALRWLNIGVNRFVPDLDVELEMGDVGFELLRERSLLRRELELPKDGLDDLFDQLTEHGRQISEQIKDIKRRNEPTRIAVLFWPPAEFAKLQQEHPSWYPDTTHLQHRQQVQHALRQHAGPAVAIGSIEALVGFAVSRGLPVNSASTRSQFAAEAARLGQATEWPPGRNDTCWCGSARKYKKCCGAPGFA
ncbi:SEC-C domain-containing protein [Saccharopolyspora sp. K220]|uniref:SEC-C domain-containing protein n=1 Tax=Saccharopolyspora soli TaxID=2926618 RepID=UPI001F592B0D|nr:SEC-C domain-containing protein [Saccharopolyspora soli]MCI2423173.1 SEC-C domain-containing protein [Saccharopolyspora soli]